jgi:hypothetical protein
MERYEDILQLKIHLSKLSIIFKEWRVMSNVDRGGVIVLFIL